VSYTGYSGLTGPIILSLLLHIAILTTLFLFPSFPSPKLTFGPVYNVSLVDFVNKSPIEGGGLSPQKPFNEGKGYRPEVKRRVVERNTVPVYRVETKSDHRRAYEKAIEDIKKKVAASTEEQKPSPHIGTVQTHKSAEASRSRSAVGPPTTGQTGSGGAPYSSSRGGAVTDTRVDAYYREVWFRIKEKWVLPQVIIPKEGLESVIVITVLRTGAIVDFRFEKPSGNKYFDESAMKAVQKANPLPPLPLWMGGGSLSLGIRFHSSEWGS